jgi:alpha-1,2-glucosyltransferase
MPRIRISLLLLLVSLSYALWFYQVNDKVQEPYLDEVFHIRQAQAYCDGQFGTWDPKITTPPGLYIISYILLRFRRLVSGENGCSVIFLRCLNTLVALFILPVQARTLHRYKYGRISGRNHEQRANVIHTASNICLFPLLFFFSALYYTDVCSVSLVLDAYQYHLRSLRDAPTTRWVDGVMIFFIGICALFMRQTNIFWVAVFLAGLQAVHHLKKLDQLRSAKSEAIYDPPISEAYLEGKVCCKS